ncbi:MAG: tetratricopeptide repeat protein, partial [candidate division Zixibacteria bacterium]|nr:tetratricopeptide repeat protein [candidate division Zixibacteria bacterium]
MKAAIKILVVLLVVFGLNCVYYNTFYNAKKKFNQAQKAQQKNEDGVATQAEKTLYEESIEKASKVLTFHSDSKYVDDALYLIGKSYYNMEEWRKASRKFRELMVNFPESEYVNESVYLSGMCEYHIEDYDQAREYFYEVLATEKSDYKDDAAFMLGEIPFGSEEFVDAIDYYQEMLERYPKSDLAAKTYSRIGECYFKLEDYSKSKTNYDLARKKGPDTDLKYEILYAIGECHYKLDEYRKGLEIYRDLKGDRKYFDKLAQIKIMIAEGLAATDEIDEALENYEEITVESPRTMESAEAYYKIGQIHERRGELEKAKEAYDKGKDENRESEYAELSLAKSSEINKLESYRSALDDSTAQDLVKTQLLLAEAMLFEFSQPDSAIKEYKRILLEYPYSQEAALAYFALGYIYRNIKADTAMSDSFYIELAGRYPASKYGLRAAEILGILEAFSDSLNTEE